jgi:DNA polymerase-3 subunit gamma/tau
VKDGSEPRIQLELALLKATQPQADQSLQALMFRIEQLELRLAGEAPPEAAPAAPQADPAPEARQPASQPPPAAVASGGSRGPSAAAAVAEPEADPDEELDPAPALELERVQALWPAVADAVREENAMVGALVAHARPTALEDGRLTVCFPEEQAFSKKKAESNRELAERALRGLTGARVSIVYELSADAPASEAAMLTEEQLIERLRSELGAEEVFED